MSSKLNGDPQRDCIVEIQRLYEQRSLASIKGITGVPTSTLHRWVVGPILPISRYRQGFTTPSVWTAERVLENIDKKGEN